MIHLGSDTGGSIRQPAAYCGATGFKPTYGRVSRYGLLAFASSLDQIGMLQSDAEEAALALATLAGHDPRDSTSADVGVPDYLAELAQEVGGLKIGVAAEFFPQGVDSEVEHSVREAIEVYRKLGIEVREVRMPHIQYANQVYLLISAAEASSNLARYDGVHFGYRTPDPANVLDLYARSRAEGFGAEVKRRILMGTFVLSSGYYDAFYSKACRVRRLIRADFDAAFKEVDAIVCPTCPLTAFPIGERVDDPLKLYALDVLTVPANLASIPGVSVPCGVTGEGLPIGLQVYGRPFEDSTVLRLAHAFQQSTPHHQQAPEVQTWEAE
jgi:aspartyl-tRNA(Asn)/glutamyl-tRNA(Gln) amidotransferase subunit A